MEKVLNRFSFDNMNEFVCSSLSKKHLFSLPNHLGFMYSEKEIISEYIYLFKHGLSNSYGNVTIENPNAKFDSLFINILINGTIHAPADLFGQSAGVIRTVLK
ncbi:hypothetical protein [Aliarcobacter butzleri]|uniref:hypothetical protein n=1 Tax=Aliarcobacter butzleri TaxID=28197 RepID=UPI001260713A|nr:hypothetical protein [Aliarcobacter butzleri]